MFFNGHKARECVEVGRENAEDENKMLIGCLSREDLPVDRC